jgi:hypothetical protein
MIRLRRHRLLFPARRRRRGAILVLVAFLVPIMAIFAAFAVDVAWMQLVNTELRTATDAAARAGAKVLSVEQDTVAARAAAIDAASRNKVAGVGLQMAASDVQFGRSNQVIIGGRFQFVEASSGLINAIHIDGQRTEGSLGGPVNLFFSRVMGINSFEPRQEAVSTVLDRDVCLVIDRSGSMGLDVDDTGTGNGQNCGPLAYDTRFAALDRAIEGFLEELDLTFPNEQVALASYSSSFSKGCSGGNLSFQTADIREALTHDYNAIRSDMNVFMTKGIGGNTAIGEGLKKGIQAINGPKSRPFAAKTIVLMTDGLHNTGTEPIVFARQAADQEIVVHTITFSAAADKNRMRAVAEETGGRHYHADSEGDLNEIFREIARTLPVLLTQ